MYGKPQDSIAFSWSYSRAEAEDRMTRQIDDLQWQNDKKFEQLLRQMRDALRQQMTGVLDSERTRNIAHGTGEAPGQATEEQTSQQSEEGLRGSQDIKTHLMLARSTAEQLLEDVAKQHVPQARLLVFLLKEIWTHEFSTESYRQGFCPEASTPIFFKFGDVSCALPFPSEAQSRSTDSLVEQALGEQVSIMAMQAWEADDYEKDDIETAAEGAIRIASEAHHTFLRMKADRASKQDLRAAALNMFRALDDMDFDVGDLAPMFLPELVERKRRHMDWTNEEASVRRMMQTSFREQAQERLSAYMFAREASKRMSGLGRNGVSQGVLDTLLGFLGRPPRWAPRRMSGFRDGTRPSKFLQHGAIDRYLSVKP
mmetsp:Transcript_19035/g.33526  ORF Transcript_19035/g.33526 Transcript_19035/m.33526 type:complete len:370 (-) Transcript_19035:136-1245(-)